MLNCNCPECGKFASTLARQQKDKTVDVIFKCKKCNITYSRSIGWYLAVHGDMEQSISGIQENSPRWIELMRGESADSSHSSEEARKMIKGDKNDKV